ncbi:MAG TPA: M14 family metallopeptidase [Longimicrobiales bacterium]|nr:M14 family metallopeptidase [Longimicrobiales bacterium]
MRFRLILLMLMVASGCASAAPAVPTPAPAHAPAPAPVHGLLTRAERSGWLETSRYDDVVAFIDSVDASPRLHATTFGYSMEGRALPLVVAGASSPEPANVRSTGRTRVLVFANIHAGEVEGKEATQILLRELAAGEHRAWTDSLVLLIAPIYNADGNERIRLDHRSDQHGPFAGVGTRENAQGLDLNRDHTKLESPEARSLVRLMTEYDPHVVVDLHTTNGTHHAYHLTYSPPLHPATDDTIVGILRERWLPDVTRAMEARGWLTWYYGNLPIREWGMTGERGWYTFDYRARFNNSYAGLRNRFGILSEAYSYASFEDRVQATRIFVTAVLDWAAANATGIRSATEAADRADLRGTRLPLRAEIASSGDTIFLLGEVEARVNPLSGERYLARLDVVRGERMPNYDRFAATETERVPSRYVIPDSLTSVLDLLRAHGIRVRQWQNPDPTIAVDYAIQRFRIDSTHIAERPFQGHREREVFGAWRTGVGGFEEDDWIVDMNQPLARVAFALLEPRAPDGVVNWGFLDDAFKRDPTRYPIRRFVPGARLD